MHCTRLVDFGGRSMAHWSQRIATGYTVIDTGWELAESSNYKRQTRKVFHSSRGIQQPSHVSSIHASVMSYKKGKFIPRQYGQCLNQLSFSASNYSAVVPKTLY